MSKTLCSILHATIQPNLQPSSSYRFIHTKRNAQSQSKPFSPIIPFWTISWGTNTCIICLSITLVTSTNFSRNRAHWHTDEHDANDIHDLFVMFSMYCVYLSIKVVVSILQTARQFVLKHCGTNAFARCPHLLPIIRVSNKFFPSRIRQKNRSIDSDDERMTNFFSFVIISNLFRNSIRDPTRRLTICNFCLMGQTSRQKHCDNVRNYDFSISHQCDLFDVDWRHNQNSRIIYFMNLVWSKYFFLQTKKLFRMYVSTRFLRINEILIHEFFQKKNYQTSRREPKRCRFVGETLSMMDTFDATVFLQSTKHNTNTGTILCPERKIRMTSRASEFTMTKEIICYPSTMMITFVFLMQ